MIFCKITRWKYMKGLGCNLLSLTCYLKYIGLSVKSNISANCLLDELKYITLDAHMQ